MPGGDDETRQESLLHDALGIFDRLEAILRQGGAVPIESCLAKLAMSDRPTELCLLVALELAARRGRGEEPLESEYSSKVPRPRPDHPRGVLPTSERGGEHADLRVPGRIERDGAIAHVLGPRRECSPAPSPRRSGGERRGDAVVSAVLPDGPRCLARRARCGVIACRVSTRRGGWARSGCPRSSARSRGRPQAAQGGGGRESEIRGDSSERHGSPGNSSIRGLSPSSSSGPCPMTTGRSTRCDSSRARP